MSKKPANPQAFPYTDRSDGMTLRDYFAAKAMQSIVTKIEPNVKEIYFDRISKDAYDIADGMLKQREL